MAIFHFHITDFHCSVCGKLVEPNKVKLAYISKRRSDADDRGRILLQKNVLKAVFPNLKLFLPLTINYTSFLLLNYRDIPKTYSLLLNRSYKYLKN